MSLLFVAGEEGSGRQRRSFVGHSRACPVPDHALSLVILQEDGEISLQGEEFNIIVKL